MRVLVLWGCNLYQVTKSTERTCLDNSAASVLSLSPSLSLLLLLLLPRSQVELYQKHSRYSHCDDLIMRWRRQFGYFAPDTQAAFFPQNAHPGSNSLIVEFRFRSKRHLYCQKLEQCG